MRLYEITNGKDVDGDKNSPLPELWIPHPQVGSPTEVADVDQLFKYIDHSVANATAHDAVDKARGYSEWEVYDDDAIDLNVAIEPETIVSLIRDIFYIQNKYRGKEYMRKVLQRIIDGGAWVDFIANLEKALKHYSKLVLDTFKNGWTNAFFMTTVDYEGQQNHHV